MLAGKRITLGVTGGIAAYKAAELASKLTQIKSEVRVIMTRSAEEFIKPLTFQALTGNSVFSGLFQQLTMEKAPHIELAGADLIVVAPATANILGKVACGIADDLLSTVIMAAQCPVLICPSMNVNMYNNPIVQANMAKLREMGYHLLEPEEGWLACRLRGRGRLPETEVIINQIKGLFTQGDLKGLSILITAGPTRELLDPVRYLTNRSSGKMGYAIAKAASARGAQVILVSGPTNLTLHEGVTLKQVESAREMYEAVVSFFPKVDVVIKAAAVADYRPKKTATQKIKKNDDTLFIEFEKNPDILLELGHRKQSWQTLVGFAAETEDIETNALIKIKKKNLDLLVVNDVTQEGVGFEVDTNIVKLVYPEGRIVSLPLMDKLTLAYQILDEVKILRQGIRYGG